LKLSLVAGFEVLTVVLLKIGVFWDVTQCRLVKSHRRIGGSHSFRVQGQTVKLLGLADPQDEGIKIPRDGGNHSPVGMV
jgi:hypothetical protein